MQRFFDFTNTDDGASRPILVSLGHTYHPDIGMVPLPDAKTMRALATRFSLPLCAVHRLSQTQGQSHLTNMGRADQQVGVGQSIFRQTGSKLFQDVVLTVDLPHGLLFTELYQSKSLSLEERARG